MKKTTISALLFCFTSLFVVPSQAVEVAGVKVAETIQTPTSNATLKLNGTGVRYKIFFKVYVASLYLPETKKTADEVLDFAGPKQLNLTMLRDLESKTLSDAFNEGVKRNTKKEEMEKLSNQFDRLDQLFSTIPKLKKGDVISIEWVPKVGTMISFNGKLIGEKFTDEVFFNALLRIWLGEDPVSADLKNKLLGG